MTRHSHNVNKNIAVIADDLTGANDTGVQFAKQGLKTIVLMGLTHPPSMIEEDVVVVDTQSRALSPDEAYRKVADAARFFRESRFQVLFKKMDSTLRGNPGREIDAIMDACGQELAIVAPAFPKNGRTTIGGHLLLEGVPLEDTEIARDTLCPVMESHIPTLLSSQTVRKVGHLGIKSISAGQEQILETMIAGIADGERVIVCDAWRDEHLRMIAAAAMRLEKPLLWVGSAGLAETLPSVLGWDAVLSTKGTPGKRPAEGQPVVILAGSVSHVTRGQVKVLKQRADIEHIEMDPCELLRPETEVQEIRRCFAIAITAAKAGRDIVITTGYSSEIVERVRQKTHSLNLSAQKTADAIADAMGSLCRQIAMNAKLGGLVLTGGDIARSCCSRLSAAGLRVVEEVATGIPLCLLKGGDCDGLGVITKAGAFGSEEALCKALDCLKQHHQGGVKL
jgi:uncharacterized protein YgbK (DUF1537 family)